MPDYYALMVDITAKHAKEQYGITLCTGDWGYCECAGCQSEREHHWEELASEDARMERGRP